ncbi:hypothetical protein BAU15_10525 [Enterococcus sp. JM4C]|uniref:biotin/lipoyl-binding protein n=1 Tax=Candidatus Enterococcus huntleyi TaxID=1857217 RepID=UPI00137B05A1|nr:biotin/lipoyl-binding protein [Enterococcus sp. JM4C]KAF1296212.1 hypothetical protein BAU15_10525 [Enterococcus sp. JM4C]
MKKKGLKIIGYFLLAMLVLTLLSRLVTSALTPKVKVGKVTEQFITHQPVAEGLVTYKQQQSLTMVSELFVDSVDVVEGQQVKKGQLLYRLNRQKIDEKVQAIEGEIAKLQLQNTQSANERAVEADKQQRAIQRAAQAHDEAIRYGNQVIQQAQEELQDSQNQLKALDKNKESYEEEKKQLEAAVTEKRKAYDEAIINKDKEVNEARRRMEETQDPVSEGTSIEQNQQDIDQKQRELNQLKRLQTANGEIKASLAGLVTHIGIKAGGLTTGEAPLLLADPRAGLRLQLSFLKEEQKYLTLGTEVRLARVVGNEEGKEKLANQKITSITEDKEDPSLLNVLVDLPAEGIAIGETVKAEINVPATKYQECIPIEALKMESGNAYYVYSLATKDTVLGKEKVLEKIKVELLDKNTQFAAVTGINHGKEVVVSTDKEIGKGTTVRVNEE